LLLLSRSCLTKGSSMGNPELQNGIYRLYRFLKIRQGHPGRKMEAQMGAIGPDHLTCGLGFHRTCALAVGLRFNEIKPLLCHLLLVYDWKVANGADTSPLILTMMIASNPTAHKRILRRKVEEMEVDIELL